MPYRLETDESVQQSFTRCALEQLDRATQELTDGVRVDRVEAIHEARKALKMERSLLRLGREAIPGKVRRRQNAALRETARRLSGARDADVMVEALQTLSERFVGQVPEATFAAVRGQLEAERAELASADPIPAAVEELRAARDEVASWRLRRQGWDAIEGGLVRDYKRGQAAFRRAQRKPTVENLHAWRKRVKDAWYALRLLQPAAPLTLDGQVKEAHALSDLLGDDHDLAVLAERVGAIAERVPADVEPVLALIDHRRAELQQEARFIGERLYAEKPKAFTRRIKRYWKTSRAEQQALSARPASEVAERTDHAPVV